MKFSTHKALTKSIKINISGFAKIQYGHKFLHFSEFFELQSSISEYIWQQTFGVGYDCVNAILVS